MVVSLGEELTKPSLPVDEMVLWPPDPQKKKGRDRDWINICVVLALVVTAGVFAFAAWNDADSRFQEFEKYIKHNIFSRIDVSFLCILQGADKYR